MPTYRCSAVADLALQLARGPSRLAPRQLLQVEFLLSVIQEGKAYPYEFVQHALTGYRPIGEPIADDESRLIEGSALREDLSVLAEEISERAGLSIDEWPEAVFTVSELAQRFDVSTKTIFRWRQRGLIGWRFRFADRRTRIAFPDRCVRRFVAENSDLVVRGSQFSQLTAEERKIIVDRGAVLVQGGMRTVNSVSKQIALETGRAVETIRLILKHHDEAHPKTGIFNRPSIGVEADDLRLKAWEAYVDGSTVEQLAARFNKSIAWTYRAITQMRAKDIKARKIEYIYSPDFDDPAADERILQDPALKVVDTRPSARIPANLAPYLAELFAIPLLTPARELALFRKFNYLKYKADRQARAIDPETVRPVELDRIEALQTAANAVKNEIVQANLRLVVSIAKRHARPASDFFEIISDGNISLMKAAEKFDFTRGFKFSTYASWAIMKNYARTIPEEGHQLERYQTGREEVLDRHASPAMDEHEDEALPLVRATLDRMMDTLSEREQSILRQHYGLDDGGRTMTLEEIGRKLGVSKERIRQIEARAFSKLRGGFGADAVTLLGSIGG